MTNYYKKGNRLLSVLIFSLWSVFSFGQQAIFKEGVKQGSVKIKFSGQLASTLKKMNVTTTGKKLTTGIQAFDQVSSKVGAKNMHRLFPENPNPRLEAKLRKHKLDLWYVVDIDANQSAKDAASKYKGISEIEIAETEKQKVLSDYNFTPVKISDKKSSAVDSYFNDPKLPEQWHYNNTGQTGYPNGSDINLFKAWDIVKGNPQVIVSIHDQGVDIEHPDLKGNIWTNQAELNGVAGVDDDGNGYIDDIHGWNYDKKSGAIDAEPHGTHVAGTIAAVNNNGIGVCGVAGGSGNNDGSKVMSLQCLGGGGFEQSYIYAANNGAVISQNSWGYTSPGNFDESIKEAIDYFIAEAGDYPNSPMKGGIVIFAAGNSNSDGDWYPGHYENTLSVSSIGPNWERASYSNYGTWVDIAAPGGETDLGSKNGVLSTLPKNQYGFYQGTSMACPHVSGIAALALANRKSQLTPEVLKTKLLTGVVDIDSHNPDYAGKLGSGHIDAYLAIQNNEGIAPNAITDLTLTGIAQEFANLSWTVPADSDDKQPVDLRIYYSTSPITKSNLGAAKYDIIKTSDAPGTTVTHSISGLLGLTTYYFTVISGDRWNNLSELSNIVQGTTNAGPKITVDDNSKDIVINVDASTSFKGTHDMTILNNGEGVLRWEFLARHKETSLSYSAKKINYPSAKTVKVASAGKLGRKKSKIAASAKTAAVAPFSFTPQEKGYVDGVTDIIGDTDTKIPNSAATKYVVNEAEGFNLTQIVSYLNVDPQFGPVVVEIYKGNALKKENVIYAQEYTPFSANQGYAYITLNEQLYFQQGETFWVVMHVPAGNLYPLSIGYENTSEGSDNSFISFDVGQTWGPLSVALDSNDFAWFTIASSQNKYLGEYLTLDPANGEVNGNSNQKTILSADASTLINGTYQANAILKSNDATQTELRIPVTVNVSGQQAVLKSVEKLDFSSVFKGTSKELEFVVKNTGLGNFNDIAVNISNPNFELISSAPYQLSADSEVTLRVKYTPNAIGNDNGLLTLTSASSPKTLKVILFGVSSEPAKIVVDPMTQLIDNVALGDQVTASVTVKNEGQAALKYFVPKYDQSGTSDTWEGEYHKYGYKLRTSYASETSPLTYEYQDISATGTDITNYFKAQSNRYFPVEMGFDFPYYKDKMKTLYISHQGFTTFDDTTPPTNFPDLNGAPYSPKGYISPLGTFVELAAGGSVHYKVEPDRVIVQFTNVSDGYSGTLTAQMVLFADGNIRFYYDNITFSDDDLAYLNILIEDYDQVDGILINNYNKRTPIYSGLALGLDYPGPDMITSISNAGGILLPGESAKMDVVMETAALHEGMINRYLNIVSTDPLNTQVNPLVQINITSGGKADIAVSHTDIDFGDAFQGAIVSRKFSIKNNGTAPVTLTSFALDNNKFQITGETSATVAPGLSKVYDVTMPTDVVASLTDVLRIKDDKGGSYTITLSGKVLDPPGINVTNLDLITETLQHGQTSKHNLFIENTGTADLEVVATGTNWLTMSEPISTSEAIPNFTYSYETFNDGTNYQWIDIRKTGTQLPFPEDVFDVDDYWNKITLPWSFNFYGKDYTDVNVGNTGLLTFDKPEQSAAMNDAVPTDLFKTMIAPYWTFGGFNTIDFAKEDVGVFYYSDADKVIISWEYLVNNFGMGDPTSAQVIFYKNGTMKFQYKVNGTVDNNTNVTAIGLQNGDHSDFVAISNYSNVNHGSGLAYVISPAQKQVIPAGTTLNAQIDIDARNIYAGEYDSKLKLRTNVPGKEWLEKPIHLTVTGAPIITSNVTEINYGEIMVNPAASYTQEFLVQNTGAEKLQISNISIESGSTEYSIETYAYFEGWFGDGYWSWANINDLAGNYAAILPGENAKFRITYAPTAAGSVSDHIVIDSNATVAQLLIPIKAEVTLPPSLAVQTKEVNSVVNYLTDKDTQYAIFDNTNGGGTLKYELSIDYLRKAANGTTPSSASKSITKIAKSAKAEQFLKSMPAPKGGVSAYADPSFNRVLSYENKMAADTHFGYDGGEPFTTATRFNAGKEGFTLSHFQTFMFGIDKPSGTINYEIRAGGTSAADATIIEQGSVDYVYEGGKTGAWVTLPIKEAKGLYPNEDFYIIITYPYELPFVQGAIAGIVNTPGRYTLTDGEDWYDLQDSDLYPGYGWMVRAGEENYTSNAWVVMNGLSDGTIAPGGKKEVQLDFTAANGARGDQHAVLNIRTNDPVTSVGKIPVKLHINEAPVFSNLPVETTVVSEASEVVVKIGLTDKEANKITVQSANAPSWATFELVGSELSIKLAPGYETAGTYTLNYTAVDELGASTEAKLEVEVLKTNRAPEAIQSEELVYSKLNFFDVRKFGDYFTDPDADKMTFNATVANENIVTVTVGQELGQFVVETHAAGETILTLTATDAFGLSTVQQIKVTVVNNKAPLALGAQAILFNKLSVQETFSYDKYFSDPDGDQLTFEATVVDGKIASIAQSATGFTIESLSNGETELILKATDIYGATAEQHVTVIVNQSEVMELNIFPNPVVNTINIKWTSRWAGDVVVEVVALNGAIVRKFDIDDVQLKTYSQLDLSTLPTGAYFLHVSGKEGTSSVFKFIKRSGE